jgi:hypothetical protein
MLSPIQNDDHELLGKLYHEVLPPIVGGLMATPQWFTRWAAVYEFGGQFWTALTGLGIGAPLIEAVKSGKGLAQWFSDPWSYVGIALFVIYAAFKAITIHWKVIDRALFARECSRAMGTLKGDLEEELFKANPIGRVNEIKEIAARKAREAYDQQVWRWAERWPHDAPVETELHRLIAHYRLEYMRRWDLPPPGERR